MSPSDEATMPATRRTRKSIGASTNVQKAMDKENATVDVGSSLAASRKKSRSKSMGPGGLDALKQGTGNRRASLAVPSNPPRSILKPTISPLPEIPLMKKKRPGSRNSGDTQSSKGTPNQSGDDSTGSKIALKTEEEQQAAARAREEKERRDARRKSLANRRVSFAAEATLHTFHEVEYMQESTTSTDSSRRASSANQATPSSSATGRTETPQLEPENASDAHDKQLEPQQSKRRRSSGAAPVMYNNDDDMTSTIYSSDSEPPDAIEEVAADSDEGSSSDSDDGTMMSIETEEVTGTTMGSERSVGTAGESSTLDAALRMAAQRATNQRDGSEESDDLDDGEEIIPSFGWVKKAGQQNAQQQRNLNSSTQQHDRHGNDETTDIGMDMDMTNAVGRIINSNGDQEIDQEEEMSMDVTQAFGGILSQNKNESRASSTAEEGAAMDDATMELTTAIGGIRMPQGEDADDLEDNEDMSMELTTAMGGVFPQRSKSPMASRRRTINRTQNAAIDDATMDMTVGVGRILSGTSHSQENEPDQDATVGMDMTTALGGIVSNTLPANRRSPERVATEDTLGKPKSPRKDGAAAVSQASPSKRTSARFTETDPEPASPGVLAFRGKGLRPSTEPQAPATPQSGLKSKTPSPAKTSTPRQDPRSDNRRISSTRSKSPKSASRKRHPLVDSRTPSPAKPAQSRASFWHNDPKTGERTPNISLTPQQRRLSGAGADRKGLGSPLVAALFDRRGSIGETADYFVPGKRTVAFEDPQKMAEDIDKERQNEEDKENRRKILEREADGSQEDKDGTLNLREMIDSLSPARKFPKGGRKSLHVGSARGVLGKRPAELDDEDETDDNDGVKRLKNHQSSPVKNVRLKQPPSAAETTGRLTRSARFLEPTGQNLTPTHSSPLRKERATTPRNQGRFKDVTDDKNSHTVHEVNFQESSPAKDVAQLEDDAGEDRIHLQDFLNMTSIRFMELTTTKRRHTMVPTTLRDGSLADGQDDLSLERCVVAGACTVPMLELYQHSCRELKKYISEGRGMVHEIEADTLEENPPLFREYMSATSDVKTLMDNQFKNVKTHARLQSKAMWYEWRMKLQEGLREGLVRIAEGMKADDEHLQKQQDLLSSVIPALVARFETLEEESTNLEEAALELADCDPTELQDTREELTTLDEDIAEKKKLIAQLRQDFEASEADVEGLTVHKQQCLADIEESEKIREECRGWTSTEINVLKGRVDAIEEEHGWAVTGLSGTTLSMAYKREIEIVFDIASFQPSQANSQIDIWYIGHNRQTNAIPKTAEKEFFLQCIRDHVRSLPQSDTAVFTLLEMVRLAWERATTVSTQINRINVTFPTTVTKTSDSTLAVTSSLLLVPLETKVEVTLNLGGRSGADGVEVGVSADAKVVYGEHFNVAKVGEFLLTRIGNTVGASEDQWSDVMVELHGRLIARGRK